MLHENHNLYCQKLWDIRPFRVIWNTLITINMYHAVCKALLYPLSYSARQIFGVGKFHRSNFIDVNSGYRRLILFPKSLRSEEAKPGCASPVLTTTPHCPLWHGQPKLFQTEESGWLALILCNYLHDVVPLSWMSLKADHGCCHCLVNIAAWSGQRIQTVA